MNESLPEAASPLTGADAGREILRALVDSSWNVLVVLDDSCHVLAMNEAARTAFDAGMRLTDRCSHSPVRPSWRPW